MHVRAEPSARVTLKRGGKGVAWDCARVRTLTTVVL